MRYRNPTIAAGVIAAFAIVLATLACGQAHDGDAEQTTGPLLPAPSQTAGPAPGVAPASSPVDTSRARCGVERWAVKTLTDPDVGLVDFVPVPATIDQLSAYVPPSVLPQNSRVVPLETQVYTITAIATDLKQEADGDFHLAVKDPTNGHTFIVEFPDAAHCVNAAPQLRAEMATARAAIVAAYGQPSTTAFAKVSGMVTVTGPGFFDKIHGQRGVARNGAEIHPVLSVSVQR